MKAKTTPAGDVVEGHIIRVQGGIERDGHDDQRIRQGRSRHEGFAVSSYTQSVPMFLTRDGHSLWIADTYRGAAAFMVLGGPSFGELDQVQLRQPGILTFAINNSVRTFRPDVWISVDSPTNFISSVWLDPRIQKFVPICHAEKHIWDNFKWEESTTLVGDCPNVMYYRRNEHFQADQFLFEDSINWGNSKHYGGQRSVMLAAVRIAFLLGVRTLYLLGCDFKMALGDKNYHFPQDRAKGSIKGNTETYAALNTRFDTLRPIFEKHGFNVYNCNADSGLKSFDHVSYADAIAHALKTMPDVENEPTEGLYDRDAKEKAAKKAKGKPKKVTMAGLLEGK